MTTTPDPQTVREIVRKHIRSGRTDIGLTLIDHFGNGALGDEEYDAWERAVRPVWRTELRAVSWPDEQPQDAVAPYRPLPDDEEFISILQGGSFYAEVTAFRRLAATIGVEQTYRKWTKLQRRARTDAGRPLNEQPQDGHCPECGASGYLWRPDDRECEVCVAVADVENAIDDLAEKVEQQQADPDIRHLTVQTKLIVAHMCDLAQENAKLHTRKPQDERDARIAELEREVRQLRAGAPRAWKQDLHSAVGRFENFINATRSYDSDHLGGIMRGGNAEATITLGDLRAVLARLAELEAAQDERDGDVRAVARLLASADGSITEMFAAHEALEARFADRIAALDARDATEAGR